MSGLKYSRIELEREQKARQEARAGIDRVGCELNGMGMRIREMLASIPRGVQDSFPGEMEKVKNWQREVEKAPRPEDGMTSQELNEVLKELNSISSRGTRALRILTDVQETKRDAKAREIIGEIELLKGSISGAKEKMDLWKPDLVRQYLSEAVAIVPLVEEGEFVRAQAALRQLKDRFERSKRDIFDREARHQERLYVMNALKDVCRTLGFGEEEDAHLENDSDRGSPLIYKVDTYDEGLITFKLTLDGIEAQSAISTRLCMKEFNNLSEQLSEKFGVKTRFKVVTPLDDGPELLQKGELDLPDGGEEVEMEHEAEL